MKAMIYPSFASGEVRVPSSKSIAHRAIICASLADKESIISNIDFNDDILSTISCLKQLGADILINKSLVIVKKTININFLKEEVILNSNESASTLRFLIPLSSKISKKVTFCGSEKLISRPEVIYKNLYEKENKQFHINKDNIKIQGSLESETYEIDGNISSQFISGLLFCLPLLEKDSKIIITKELESVSYIDLTISVLKDFGIDIKKENNIIYIKGHQSYKARDYVVEGDYSQASYFLVLGSLNGNIKLTNLNFKSLQGDKAILEILNKLNVKVKNENDSLIVSKTDVFLKNLVFDLKDNPDLAPILTILLSQIKGDFCLTNVKRLKYKESNRIISIEDELKKLNIDISHDENNIYIKGSFNLVLDNDIMLFSHNDHRIFMALAVLGALVSGHGKIIIEGVECINKSYPMFLTDLEKLNIKIKYIK